MNSGNSAHQRQVVEHVERYRVSTSGLLSQYIDISNEEAATAVTTLLQERRLQVVGEFFGELVLRCEDERHLSDRCRDTSLATVYHCASRSVERRLLTADDLQEFFPDLYRPERDRQYFVERKNGVAVLVRLCIDHGGAGRWDRILGKAIREMKRHINDEAIRRLVYDELFEVRILTAFESKRQRLHDSLAELDSPLARRVTATTQPELGHLLFLP